MDPYLPWLSVFTGLAVYLTESILLGLNLLTLNRVASMLCPKHRDYIDFKRVDGSLLVPMGGLPFSEWRRSGWRGVNGRGFGEKEQVERRNRKLWSVCKNK